MYIQLHAYMLLHGCCILLHVVTASNKVLLVIYV